MKRILNWVKNLFKKNQEPENEMSDSMSMLDAYREYKAKNKNQNDL